MHVSSLIETLRGSQARASHVPRHLRANCSNFRKNDAEIHMQVFKMPRSGGVGLTLQNSRLAGPGHGSSSLLTLVALTAPEPGDTARDWKRVVGREWGGDVGGVSGRRGEL